jgi:outer membrane protein TolC
MTEAPFRKYSPVPPRSLAAQRPSHHSQNRLVSVAGSSPLLQVTSNGAKKPNQRHESASGGSVIGRRIPLVACGVLFLAASLAAPTLAQPLSFDDAREAIQRNSPKIAAASDLVAASGHVADATKSLHRPFVSADWTLLRYQKTVYTSTADLESALGQNGLGNGLTIPIPGIGPIAFPFAQLPQRDFEYQFAQNASTPQLTVAFPIFTGGRIEAAQRLTQSGVASARADERTVRQTVDSELVLRYFGLQLADVAHRTAAQAVDDLTRHLAAVKIEQRQGVTTPLVRLEATAALDRARLLEIRTLRERANAQDALDRFLHSEQPIAPSTPLFINSTQLEPVEAFVAAALERGTPFDQIAARRTQTSSLERLARAQFSPQILGVGSYAIERRRSALLQPDWLIGVIAQFTLADPIDRGQFLAAARDAQRAAEDADSAARADVQTLVRKAYDEVQNQRDAYLLAGSSVAAAEEAVRVQHERLRNGVGRPLDIVDAQLGLATAQTDRAKDAFAYDVALEALLQASGQTERFSEYARRADIVVR